MLRNEIKKIRSNLFLVEDFGFVSAIKLKNEFKKMQNDKSED